MKKILSFAILLTCLVSCSENTPVSPKENFCGEWMISGKSVRVTFVTNPKSGKSLTDTDSVNYTNKTLLIEENLNKLTISGPFGTTSATINNDGKSLTSDKGEFSFIDDGSITGVRGVVFSAYTIYPEFSIYNNTISFKNKMQYIGVNPANGATIIMEIISNGTGKKR